MASRKFLKFVGILAAVLGPVAASTDSMCAELGGECYKNGLECCNPLHPCDEDVCSTWFFSPTHGQTCGEDKCNTRCSLVAEECMDGVCQPSAENDCAALDEACSNRVPCCNPDHDCTVSPESDSSGNYLRNGYCEVAGAKTGEACSDDDSCRFQFDICVDGVCKVHPDVQEDAREKTTVSVAANAYDTRHSDENGCGATGCLPELTRDSDTDPESRWSCSRTLGDGDCYIEYTFGEPQGVISMNVAFYKGNERTRTIEVYGDGVILGTFTSSGATLGYENWTLNAADVSAIKLVASDLGYYEWLSITEVQLLDRRYYSSC